MADGGGLLGAAAQGAASGAVAGPWGAAAGAAIAVGMSIIKGKQKRRVEKAALASKVAIATAQNNQRKAKNRASIASADLARGVQKINNDRMLAAGADTDAVAKAHLANLQDAQSSRTFEGRIQAAEAAGGLATQAALSGVAGGSFEAIQGTLALQQARKEEIQARANATADANEALQIGNNASNMIAGIDTRAINPTIDRTINSTVPGANLSGNVVSDFVAGVNQVGVDNVSKVTEQTWTAVDKKLAEWKWDMNPQGAAGTGVGAQPY